MGQVTLIEARLRCIVGTMAKRMETDKQTVNGRMRVVITGLGMISALGPNVETTWSRMLEGRSGTRLLESAAVQDVPPATVAQIDWDPKVHMERKDTRRTSRATQFAWKATQEAIEHAQLDLTQENLNRIGIEIGDAFGGWDLIEEQSELLHRHGYKRINPIMCLAALISGTPTYIGMRLGVTGVTTSPVTACATGISAIGEGARRIQDQEVDVMLAGGSDGYITPMAVAMFARLGAMSRETEHPAQACAPFSGNRNGMIIGEGAAVVVLESLAHAQARGAPILAEFAGYALRLDPHDFTHPDPTGRAPALAMQEAMMAGGLAATDIHWIAAHGTATIVNDRMETQAIHKALGEWAPHCPVTGLKGMLGHAMGGAGAQNVVTAVKAMQENIIPPTINYRTADPDCDLDYVPNEARPHTVHAALTNGIGMGGQSASLALKRYRP